jgi:hypothetical protein
VLDILRAYDASVDLWRQILCLGEEEVSLWSPHMEPQPARLVVGDHQVIPAQCERELEELITEYEDVFATQSGDYGRIYRVYHRIDTGEARLI